MRSTNRFCKDTHLLVHDPLVRVVDHHRLVDLEGLEPDMLADHLAHPMEAVLFHELSSHERVVSSAKDGLGLADVVEQRSTIHELEVDLDAGLDQEPRYEKRHEPHRLAVAQDVRRHVPGCYELERPCAGRDHRSASNSRSVLSTCPKPRRLSASPIVVSRGSSPWLGSTSR